LCSSIRAWSSAISHCASRIEIRSVATAGLVVGGVEVVAVFEPVLAIEQVEFVIVKGGGEGLLVEIGDEVRAVGGGRVATP
jgi:hypothetical protein